MKFERLNMSEIFLAVQSEEINQTLAAFRPHAHCTLIHTHTHSSKSKMPRKGAQNKSKFFEAIHAKRFECVIKYVRIEQFNFYVQNEEKNTHRRRKK